MFISQLKISSLRLVGGLAVLDYLNTCNGRRPGSALREVVDKLATLEDVVRWFHHVRLINDLEFEHYLGLVEHPSAVLSFQRLIVFREQLYQLLLPVAEGQLLDDHALNNLNQVLASTAAQRRLAMHGRHVIWQWQIGKSLDDMTDNFIARLATQAVSLLTGPDQLRLKVCATPDCDWLFIDTSKNGGRRWCQMNICGSREKARKRSSAGWMI
ncbi:CGNR zinc finger domain-containing protein [Pseudomonas sp. DSP3-2-2]|uniref:CGNR zinc finger domain-containing protein n=1 Tax=unclassified Pseudomonas TaxID=196821 RepID=UPI003CF8ABF0